MITALLLVVRLIGQAHDRWRFRVMRRRPLSAEVDFLQERLEKLRAENELLRVRLLRMDPHRRPRYQPWERLRILAHAARYEMSMQAIARRFVLALQTVALWRQEVAGGVQRLVSARRPMSRLPELVHGIVYFLRREWPRWGTRRVAALLARLGLKVSRATVQRMLRRPPPRRPDARRRGAYRGGLRPRRPRRAYVIDFTVLKGFFRSVIVGAVLDAFSRKVLALRACAHEPSAQEACALLRRAIDCHGRPSWVVSDRGAQFTAHRFGVFLRRRGIRRRFARVGNPNLSRIDRFWRSLKGERGRGLPLWRPLRAVALRLCVWARWHNAFRPHEGLGGRVPDDVFHGRPAGKPCCVLRGRLEVTYLGGEHALPVFRLRPTA